MFGDFMTPEDEIPDTDETPEDKLKADMGGRYTKAEWAAADESYRQKMSQLSSEAAEKANQKTAKALESEKLEHSLRTLGFTKQDLLNHFPAMAENFESLEIQRRTHGIDTETSKGRENATFCLHFSAILNFLENDEALLQEIIATWPEEYKNAIIAQQKYRNHRREC